MPPTAPSLFHLKRAGGSMAVAARFGAFRDMFHHHGADSMLSLRHASAMSNAILRNMSTPFGEPSQLVDPSSSTSSFEESHRHYSIITILAIMSLFILITISIVALILGFCRNNNNAVFSLKGSSRHKARRGYVASQFELNDLDMEEGDVDTKTCRDDTAGACYYHLSDDDEDYTDDNVDDDDYYQIHRNKKDKSSRRSDDRKNKTDRSRRQRKKRKLRFRNSGYYYHLHSEDEDSDDGYRYHETRWDRSSGDGQVTPTYIPKRSFTFPQLHHVMASCIKGGPPLSGPGMTYSVTPTNLAHTAEDNHNPHKDPTSPPDSNRSRISVATKSTCCGNKTANSGQSTAAQDVHRNSISSSMCNPQNPLSDTPALLQHESTHLIRVPKSNTATRQSGLAHDTRRRLRPSAFLPSARGRGRLRKSYSFHDIPYVLMRKAQIRFQPGHAQSGKSTRDGLRQVTFKVGTLGVDTDIRVHSVM